MIGLKIGIEIETDTEKGKTCNDTINIADYRHICTRQSDF